MGKLRPGFMTKLVPGLTMMLLDCGVPQCFIVLMVVGKQMRFLFIFLYIARHIRCKQPLFRNLDYSLAERAKMATLSSLNGTKQKER